MLSEKSQAASQSQMERWNGELARFWIEHRERHIEVHESLVPHLFRGAAIATGNRVLDVGCGCGDTTIRAARTARDGYVVGLDLSVPMLDVARHLAGQAGVANVRFVRGDAQSCPLRQGSCDVVISSFGIMFFEDPTEAFVSIASVLRPHGRLAFLCWQDEKENEFESIPLRALDAYTTRPSQPSCDQFYDPKKITKLLSGAGMEGIQIENITGRAWLGRDVPDVMNYVGGTPAIRNLRPDLDEVTFQQVLTTIADQYSARQDPGGVWIHAAAWLVTARRALGILSERQDRLIQ